MDTGDTEQERCSVCRRPHRGHFGTMLCNPCWALKQSLHHASLLAVDARDDVRDRVHLMLARAIAGMAP